MDVFTLALYPSRSDRHIHKIYKQHCQLYAWSSMLANLFLFLRIKTSWSCWRRRFVESFWTQWYWIWGILFKGETSLSKLSGFWAFFWQERIWWNFFLKSEDLLVVLWTTSGNFFRVIWRIIDGVISYVQQQVFIWVGNLLESEI